MNERFFFPSALKPSRSDEIVELTVKPQLLHFVGRIQPSIDLKMVTALYLVSTQKATPKLAQKEMAQYEEKNKMRRKGVRTSDVHGDVL